MQRDMKCGEVANLGGDISGCLRTPAQRSWSSTHGHSQRAKHTKSLKEAHEFLYLATPWFVPCALDERCVELCKQSRLLSADAAAVEWQDLH